MFDEKQPPVCTLRALGMGSQSEDCFRLKWQCSSAMSYKPRMFSLRLNGSHHIKKKKIKNQPLAQTVPAIPLLLPLPPRLHPLHRSFLSVPSSKNHPYLFFPVDGRLPSQSLISSKPGVTPVMSLVLLHVYTGVTEIRI